MSANDLMLSTCTAIAGVAKRKQPRTAHQAEALQVALVATATAFGIQAALTDPTIARRMLAGLATISVNGEVGERSVLENSKAMADAVIGMFADESRR